MMLRILTVIPAIDMAGVRLLISLFFLAYLQILSSCGNEGNKNITFLICESLQVVLSGRVWGVTGTLSVHRLWGSCLPHSQGKGMTEEVVQHITKRGCLHVLCSDSKVT